MTQNSLAPDAEYVRDNDSFYGMLTAAERKLLQGMAKARTYLPGRALMLEGDPGASLTVLFDGWAKAFSVSERLVNGPMSGVPGRRAVTGVLEMSGRGPRVS